MYCIQCGNKLQENENFCTNCGTKLKHNIENVRFQIFDDQIQYQIQPTFDFGYLVLKSIGWIILISIIFFMFGIIIMAYEDEFASTITLLLGVIAPIVYLGIKSYLDSQNYKNTAITFYKTKMYAKNSFFNQIEREIKYENIKEIKMTQSVSERMCNLGTIIIATSAENNWVRKRTIVNFLFEDFIIYKRSREIIITNIKNVQEVYQKIKQVTNL